MSATDGQLGVVVGNSPAQPPPAYSTEPSARATSSPSCRPSGRAAAFDQVPRLGSRRSTSSSAATRRRPVRCVPDRPRPSPDPSPAGRPPGRGRTTEAHRCRAKSRKRGRTVESSRRPAAPVVERQQLGGPRRPGGSTADQRFATGSNTNASGSGPGSHTAGSQRADDEDPPVAEAHGGGVAEGRRQVRRGRPGPVGGIPRLDRRQRSRRRPVPQRRPAAHHHRLFESTTPKASVRAWRMRGPSVQASEPDPRSGWSRANDPWRRSRQPRRGPARRRASAARTRRDARPGVPHGPAVGRGNSIGVGGSPMPAPPPAQRSSDPSANARPSSRAVTCGQTMPSRRSSINGPTSCQRAGAGGAARAADAPPRSSARSGIVAAPTGRRRPEGLGPLVRSGHGRAATGDHEARHKDRGEERADAPCDRRAAAGHGRGSGDLPPRSRGSGNVHVLIVDRVRLARVPGPRSVPEAERLEHGELVEQPEQTPRVMPCDPSQRHRPPPAPHPRAGPDARRLGGAASDGRGCRWQRRDTLRSRHAAGGDERRVRRSQMPVERTRSSSRFRSRIRCTLSPSAGRRARGGDAPLRDGRTGGRGWRPSPPRGVGRRTGFPRTLPRTTGRSPTTSGTDPARASTGCPPRPGTPGRRAPRGTSSVPAPPAAGQASRAHTAP